MIVRGLRPIHLLWIGPAVLLGLAALVQLAIMLRASDMGAAFVSAYPGHSPLLDDAPVGIPAWLGWQHFLNSLFILLIIRTGWQVRTEERPPAMWTRKSSARLRTKNPPKRMSLTLWLHLGLDILWVANGAIFFLLLFVTGQWMRIVPTSWDVIPHAASAALQYASLDWPLENGWISYNALQILAYFTTVFIAAPLAILTGFRLSPLWPRHAVWAGALPSLSFVRRLHFLTMLYFLVFTVVHVVLVLGTGALRNLNHMYASSDGSGWVGFWIFVGSLAIIAAVWLLARPLFLRPLARLGGTVTRS